MLTAGQERYVAGLDPMRCTPAYGDRSLSEAQVRWRFAQLEAEHVGAVALWGLGAVGPATQPDVVPPDLWWDCLATFLGRGEISFTEYRGHFFSGVRHN